MMGQRYGKRLPKGGSKEKFSPLVVVILALQTLSSHKKLSGTLSNGSTYSLNATIMSHTFVVNLWN